MTDEEARGGVILRIILALFAVAILSYLRPLFFGETFALRDHLTLSIPARTYLASSLASGRLPEWWDAVGLGVPFAANPLHAALYPPAWIMALLPMPYGADLLLVAHVLLGGLGMSALAWRLGARASGSTLAGALFMASGYVASMAVHHLTLLGLSWVPWLAHGADKLAVADSSRVRSGAILGYAGVLAMAILAGDPSGVILGGALSLVVILCRSTTPGRALVSLLAGSVLALLMTAAASLPALTLLSESERARGISFNQAATWSMHPVRLVELAWPGALGDPSDPTRNLARVLGGQATSRGLDPTWSQSVHLGLPALFLALLGARGERRLVFLALSSLLFLLLAFGHHAPLYGLYRRFFLLERLVRYPEKYLAGALVIWCALAGVGLAKVLETRSKWMPIGAGLLALGLLSLVGFARVAWGPLAAKLTEGNRMLLPPIDLVAVREDVISRGARAALVAILFACALALVGRRKVSLASWLVAALVVGPLIGHGWGLQPLVERGQVASPPMLLAPVLEGQAVHGGVKQRIYRPRDLTPAGARSPGELALAHHHSAIENSASPHGLAHFPGYEPTHFRRLHELWDEATRLGAGKRLLELFDVRYVVLGAREARGTAMHPVAQDPSGTTWVLEHGGRRPRAFVATQWEWIPGDRDAMRLLFERDHAGPVILSPSRDEHGVFGAPSPPSPCEVHSPFPERVELACQSSQGGYAVLLDAWAHGWTATVDGREARVERADVIARAVAVPEGEHRVVFTYRTPFLRQGMIASAAGWLTWLFGWVVIRRRTSLAPLSPERTAPP